VFTWHYNHGKGKFDSGKLYKVARSIIANNKPGSWYISHILRLLGKHSDVNNEEFAGKYPQDVDMVNVVAQSRQLMQKTPLCVFDYPQMNEYLCKLDQKHSPPYCLERTRILEMMIDAAIKELLQMLTELCDKLHEDYVSGTMDRFPLL
jgi:hypothetical protein